MVRVLDSGESSPGSSPGWGLLGTLCCVLMGKTLYSHSAFSHPVAQMGSSKFNAGANSVMDQGRSIGVLSHLTLQKPE